MSELKPYPFYGGGVDFVKDTYMGDELLPCPFCGSTDTEIVAGIDDENTLHMVGHVTCMNCGASSGWWRDRNTAIEKWNTRHYPPEVEKAVERMKPKKVIPEKVYWAPKNRRAYFIRFLCPTCGGIANQATNRTFCNNNGCGQALDWSNDE